MVGTHSYPDDSDDSVQGRAGPPARPACTCARLCAASCARLCATSRLCAASACAAHAAHCGQGSCRLFEAVHLTRCPQMDAWVDGFVRVMCIRAVFLSVHHACTCACACVCACSHIVAADKPLPGGKAARGKTSSTTSGAFFAESLSVTRGEIMNPGAMLQTSIKQPGPRAATMMPGSPMSRQASSRMSLRGPSDSPLPASSPRRMARQDGRSGTNSQTYSFLCSDVYVENGLGH
jgi:hypothetical protein